MSVVCMALDWMKTDQGKDYVPCSSGDTELCRIEGVMLAVEVHLCQAHQRYFENREHWRVRVIELRDGQKVDWSRDQTERPGWTALQADAHVSGRDPADSSPEPNSSEAKD